MHEKLINAMKVLAYIALWLGIIVILSEPYLASKGRITLPLNVSIDIKKSMLGLFILYSLLQALVMIFSKKSNGFNLKPVGYTLLGGSLLFIYLYVDLYYY